MRYEADRGPGVAFGAAQTYDGGKALAAVEAQSWAPFWLVRKMVTITELNLRGWICALPLLSAPAVVQRTLTVPDYAASQAAVRLTRAFIYAGTPTVLASLWSVYSGPTKDLMVRFYQLLGEGKSKAEALQQAQRELRQLYPHPVYWAAFQLVGDWR